MNEGMFQLRVEDVLRAILKQKTLIIITTIIGLIAGAVLTFASYMQGEMGLYYQFTASLVISMQTDNGTFSSSDKANPALTDVQMANQVMESAVYVLNSDLVVDRAMEQVGDIGYTVSQVASAITVTRYDDTLVAEISMTWNNEEQGLAVMNAFLDCAPEVLQETFQVGNVSVVSEPKIVRRYGGTINKMLVILVGALGMFGGIGVSVVELFISPKLTDLRDVENRFGLEVLGEIPLAKSFFASRRNVRQDVDESDDVILECFSSLAHIVKNRLGKSEKNICVYVTSAIHDEGKTITAAYLAAELAAMENKVLLIDFDTKNPTLWSLFFDDIQYEQSLNAVYRGEIEVSDAILPVNGFLDILPSVQEYTAVPLDTMIIDMVRKLKQKYDYVIIDTMPVGLSSNTMNLNQVADTTLFVIRHDFSAISDIRNALGRLDKSGIQVAGCVVNGIQPLNELLSLKFLKGKNDNSAQPEKEIANHRKPSKKKNVSEERKTERVVEQNSETVNQKTETADDVFFNDTKHETFAEKTGNHAKPDNNLTEYDFLDRYYTSGNKHKNDDDDMFR